MIESTEWVECYNGTICETVDFIIQDGPKDNESQWGPGESYQWMVKLSIERLDAMCAGWRSSPHEDCPFCDLRNWIERYGRKVS